MKHIDKYQLIKLQNNKEYVVLESIIYENSNFVFLMNPNANEDQLLALVEKENDKIKINIIDLKDKKNKDLLDILVTKFTKNILGDNIGGKLNI